MARTSTLRLARNHTRSRTVLLLAMLVLTQAQPVAAEPREELVSFSCALAIGAAFKELDKLSENLVTREAISEIDDRNGQFVCIHVNPREIQVRLQSTEMTGADNRLVFAVDASTYVVRKTYFGR